jgi:hypothetical protein
MKRLGTAWRIVLGILLVAWIPVLIEGSCEYVIPHFADRFPSTILIIPYMEFITMPLTLLAAVIALFKIGRSLFLRYGTRNSN